MRRMEIEIDGGLGYVPVEQRKKEKLEIGAIAIDAIFSPIKKVNYEVENMRVGERTDFNRLKIDIETDGSISPEKAFNKAISINAEYILPKINLCHIFYYKKDYSEAIKKYLEILSELKTSGNDDSHDYIKLLLCISLIYQEINDNNKAKEFFDEAKEKNSKIVQNFLFSELFDDVLLEESGRLDYTRRAYGMLPEFDNPKILDIGCGEGEPTIELAKLSNGLITGLDVDKKALDKLKIKIEEKDLSNRINYFMSF